MRTSITWKALRDWQIFRWKKNSRRGSLLELNFPEGALTLPVVHAFNNTVGEHSTFEGHKCVTCRANNEVNDEWSRHVVLASCPWNVCRNRNCKYSAMREWRIDVGMSIDPMIHNVGWGSGFKSTIEENLATSRYQRS